MSFIMAFRGNLLPDYDLERCALWNQYACCFLILLQIVISDNLAEKTFESDLVDIVGICSLFRHNGFSSCVHISLFSCFIVKSAVYYFKLGRHCGL